MKTVAQLLDESLATICGMHARPEMYIGSSSAPGAANTLDGMLWMAYSHWASICEEEKQLWATKDAVATKYRWGAVGFADGFRDQHPNVEESAVCDFVLECWSEVASGLRIELTLDANEIWDRYVKKRSDP